MRLPLSGFLSPQAHTPADGNQPPAGHLAPSAAPRGLPTGDTEAAEIVARCIDDIEAQLLGDGRVVARTIGGTHASFFGVDDFSIRRARFDAGSGRIQFTLFLHFEGEQDDALPFLGDELAVVLSGELRRENEHWRLSYYDVESCTLNINHPSPVTSPAPSAR